MTLLQTAVGVKDFKMEEFKSESPNGQAGQNNSNDKFQAKVMWPNVFFFIFLHIFGTYGVFKIFLFQMKFLTCIYTILISYIVGISLTVGAHRLWSHRSFKVTLPLKIALLVVQTSAGQNCVWIWARDHRLHHKYSDTDADPHNSRRGFFFCHMGWLLVKKHPEVISKGKTIDMTDLTADPWIMFQKRHYLKLYFIFGFLLPTVVPLFWQETLTNAFLAYLARYVSSLNATWCVNSVAHFFGTKPFSKDIPPVESTFTSFFTSGEGWHNYHHTFPWDYKAAEFGAPLNGSTTFIDWCARHGLAYDLKFATPEMVAHRIATRGDGSHPSVINKIEKTK
ncbi:acyl-CoA Delta-9 desaturase-like isoform X2 [Rhodnius prolixus]|uniref:acyl-CoA Delta-9 desaturase-like isoform X2 n=1 Tax=Rhodnius prolixus TaxID=13249 RepID=UPI003D18D72F